MKGLPYIVFSFLMLCALCSGMNSYRNTENRIAQDVNQALEQVLVKMPNQVITTDTIRCYRSYLTIAELKDTAGIALRTVQLQFCFDIHDVRPKRVGVALHGWRVVALG